MYMYLHMHFSNKKYCILIQFWLKFVPKGHIDNRPALGHVMAWQRIGDKPRQCNTSQNSFSAILDFETWLHKGEWVSDQV